MNTVNFWDNLRWSWRSQCSHSGSPSIFATFWAPCFARNLQDCLKKQHPNPRNLIHGHTSVLPGHLLRLTSSQHRHHNSCRVDIPTSRNNCREIQLQGNPWPKLPLLISLIHQQSWSVLKLFKSCHYLQFQNSMESPEVELRNCVRLRNNPKGRQLWTGWVQLRFRRSSKPYLHHMSRIETSPKDLPSLRQWCDSVPEPSCATCVGEKR